MALPSNLQGELFKLLLVHNFRPLLKKQLGHMPTARLGGPWGGKNVAAGDGFAREDDWRHQAASSSLTQLSTRYLFIFITRCLNVLTGVPPRPLLSLKRGTVSY